MDQGPGSYSLTAETGPKTAPGAPIKKKAWKYTPGPQNGPERAGKRIRAGKLDTGKRSRVLLPKGRPGDQQRGGKAR